MQIKNTVIAELKNNIFQTTKHSQILEDKFWGKCLTECIQNLNSLLTVTEQNGNEAQ